MLKNCVTTVWAKNYSSHPKLGAGEDPLVVGDGADHDDDLVLASGLLHLAGDAGEGHRGLVDLAHEEAAQDDLVELGLGTAGQEAVKLEGQISFISI